MVGSKHGVSTSSAGPKLGLVAPPKNLRPPKSPNSWGNSGKGLYEGLPPPSPPKSKSAVTAEVVVPKVRPVVKSGPAVIPAEVRQWHAFVTARVTDRVGPEQRLRVAHLLKGMGFTGTLLFTALSPAELRDSRAP